MSDNAMVLGHVNIYVRDAGRSRDWYAKILGLHTYHYMPGRAAFLSADREQSHEVALMQVGDDAAGPQRGQVGLNHMAWRVDSLDTLGAMFKTLKDNDVEIESIADHGISLGIYFRDPDGNGVEVYYEQDRSEWPREEEIFAADIVGRGLFPGPWDDDPTVLRR